MIMIAVVGVVLLAGKVSGLPMLVALAVAAPMVAAILHRPQLGLLVLVAASPFDGLGVVIPQVNPGWKFALVGLIVVATFFCPQSARRSATRNLPDSVLPVVGLLAVGLFSAVRVSPIEALTGFKVAFVYLFVAVAAWRCPLDRSERDRLVTILMITGFVTALYGIAQQVLGPTQLHDKLGYPYNDVIRFASGDFFRSFSTFDQAAPFGLFLMIVLLVGLPVAVSDPLRPRNILYLYGLPVYGIALLLAFTSTAFVGLAVGLAYLGFRRYPLLLFGLGIVAAGMLVFAGPIAEPIASTSSFNDRVTGWSENLSQIRANPLGSGIGLTGSAAESVNKLEGREAEDRYQPDSYYFKTAYELGLVGLWLLVLLLASAFRAAARMAESATRDQAFLDGIAATVLAVVTASFFSSYLDIFPMDLFFWLFLGLVASMASSNRTDARALLRVS